MRAGLDVGGTKIDAVAIGDDGVPVHRLRVASGYGADQVVSNAAAAVAALSAHTGTGFETIGVGIPGLVDPSTGRVRHAVNLGLDDTAFGRSLADRTGTTVWVENDVNAAALGAYHLMNLSGPVAYLNLGTGLAAGLVVDGALWRGGRGSSGEIGHIPVDPNGYACPCGQHGCLETVASGSAIARLWPTGHPYPAQALFTAADEGDPQAVAVRRSVAEGVAAAIRLLVLTVDVEKVVIGGGVSHVGAPLLRETQSVLTEWSRDSGFLASLELPQRAELLPPGLAVAAVGASMLGRPAAILRP